MDITIVNNAKVCKCITKYYPKKEPFDVKIEIVNQAKEYLETRDYSSHEIAHYCMGHHTTQFSKQYTKDTKEHVDNLVTNRAQYTKDTKEHVDNLVDKQGSFWRHRKKECVVRVYPYYTEYMADEYFSQIIL